MDGQSNVMHTALNVRVNNMLDDPPMAVMQTSFNSTGFTVNFSNAFNVLTVSTIAGSHKYFVAEIHPRVNASGERVFDVTVNGNSFVEGVDIYAQAGGLYQGFEQYSKEPLGPYSDNIILGVKAKSYSSYPASIAGVEVLQLFDNPMNATTPTSTSDGIMYTQTQII